MIFKEGFRFNTVFLKQFKIHICQSPDKIFEEAAAKRFLPISKQTTKETIALVIDAEFDMSDWLCVFSSNGNQWKF